MAIRSPLSDPEHFNSTAGREHRENEFFDARILAVILVDIVKYEDRQQMIEHFSRLLRDGKIDENEIAEIMERIPDLKKTGHSGGSSAIGTLVNLKKVQRNASPALSYARSGRYLLPINAYLELPDPFIAIEITVFQIVDFAYCVRYTCYIDNPYQHVSKSTYVNSGDMVPHRFKRKDGSYVEGSTRRGPEFEPLIIRYEKEVAEFLGQYSTGLFLNDVNADDPRLPSIRVLSTPQIDLENLDAWFRAHYSYRDYLRTRNFYCRYNDAILTYQEDDLFVNSSRPKGLTLLYSEADGGFPPGTDVGREISHKADFLSDSLVEYLFPYYWILFHSHIVNEKWSVESSQLRALLTDPKIANKPLKERKKDLQTLLSFYGRFVSFANTERKCIRELIDAFDKHGRYLLAVTHQYRSAYEVDVFADLVTGVNNLAKEELTAINDVQEDLSTLLGYHKDLSNMDLTFSNISLQRQIKWLTIVAAAAGAAILVLEVIRQLAS